MNDDIRTRIALSLVPTIGAHRARLLLERVDRPADVFRLSEKDLLKIHGFGAQVVKNLRSFDKWRDVETIIKRTETLQCELLIPEDEQYPHRLREIADPPIVLWARGDVNLLKCAGIAVVGTRSPSLYGKAMAQQFCKGLVERGVTIISGLAYGIDTIAHRTTLDAQGKTIAVLGSGIDRIYPISNSGLYDRILKEHGCIITEFPPGTKPDYMNFPTRNRVVSGLSLGVLVVETANEGGSMITSRLALEQNREVFVIPHNLNNVRATGCHKLIRESSGKLVETIEDITSEFQWVEFEEAGSNVAATIKEPENISEDARKCWNELKVNKEIYADQLSKSLDLPPQRIMNALLELEFSGFVRQKPGKCFQVNAA